MHLLLSTWASLHPARDYFRSLVISGVNLCNLTLAPLLIFFLRGLRLLLGFFGPLSFNDNFAIGARSFFGFEFQSIEREDDATKHGFFGRNLTDAHVVVLNRTHHLFYPHVRRTSH